MWVFKKLDQGADWVAEKVGQHPALVGAATAGGLAAVVLGTGGLALIPIVGVAAGGAAIGSAVARDPGVKKDEAPK